MIQYFPTREEVVGIKQRANVARKVAAKKAIANAFHYIFIDIPVVVVSYLLHHIMELILSVLILVFAALIVWKLGIPPT